MEEFEEVPEDEDDQGVKQVPEDDGSEDLDAEGDEESEEDAALVDQLDKIEKQDVNYRDKIMQQNQQDLDKASSVKDQKKVLEAIVYQRMIMQKNLTRANQLPQSEQHSHFEEKKSAELSQLKTSLRENMTTLNDICILLGKRMNVNLKPVTESSETMLKTIDDNYERLIPTCEELIQKWHSRTQVNTNVLNKKLNKRNVTLGSLQQPILTQVYKTLENKQFIETRSHQKKDVFRVLGKPADTITEKLDFQIYEDYEFYQSLTKEFLNSVVESSAPTYEEAGTNMSLTQEYLRKREKMRKMLDKKKKKSNKISKDRKLKYIIHDKLINFMAPQGEEQLSVGREDILKILFGCSTQETVHKKANDYLEGAPEEKQTHKRQKVEDDDEDLGMELI